MHRNRRNVWLARSALVLGLWGGVTAADAVGLGKMTVLSALDEPLRAEIELMAASPAELKKLNAGLAPRTEFESAGIDRPRHLFDIKYTVAARSDGRTVLKLSTDQPVREPFLHFLLQLDWAGGRLIREYTALLDPPHLLAAQPDRIEAPRAEAPANVDATAWPETAAPEAVASVPTVSEPTADRPALVNPATASADEELYGPDILAAAPQSEARYPAPTASESADAAAVNAAPNGVPSAVTPVPPATIYGPVKRGETLSTIVHRLPREANISAEQTMLALLKHNKSAFIGNNVNNLRTGKVLNIPTANDIAAIPSAQAARDFRAQYNSWQEYKLKLANAAQAIKQPVGDGASAKGEIAAKPASAADAKIDSAPAKGTNTELLKIVRANADATAKGNNESGGRAERHVLSEKVSTLEEVISSKELENKELRERVTQLEAQIKNTKRLMEIESKDLAKAQNQASKAPIAAAPNVPPSANAPAGADEKPKPASEVAPAIATAPKPAEAPRATTKPAVVPTASPAGEEPDFLSSLMANSLLLPVGGALLAVLFGGLLIYYRRRRRALAEFGESILSGGLNMNSEGTPANPADANAGEVSFLSDFSQGGMGNIHTDEVDPIAEAEVYLAYGRDEQAEEILKEAVIKDPGRHELRLKLLEIYHQRNDVGAFETVAEELYAALEGKGGKIWEAVEEMGYKMNADNPMFRAGARRSGAATTGAMAASLPAAAAMTDADALSFDMPKADADDGSLDYPTASLSPAAAQPDAGPGEFSFDLDFSTADAGAANTGGADMANDIPDQPTAADTGIDFDFSSFALEDNATAASSEANSADAGDTLDFSTDHLGAAPSPNEVAFDPSALDDDAIEATGVAGDDAQIDETATKLDLAKAYIDMGDADGARSILDEVLAEGNDTQRQQAAALAAQIAA